MRSNGTYRQAMTGNLKQTGGNNNSNLMFVGPCIIVITEE